MNNYETQQYPTPAEAREGLRTYLIDATNGCAMQQGSDGQPWPCGTCLLELLTAIGLNSREPEYQERSEMPDRANEVWRAILQIRDADLASNEQV